jgi:biotin carboxyl carrier protein
MQFTDYKIADIKDKTQIVECLAKIENDLSADIGGDVVLIAYQKDEAVQS